MLRDNTLAGGLLPKDGVLKRGFLRMHDMHCHILPGVDDGSRSMDESLAMLAAARKVGITSMVCTPHCRGDNFDYNRAVMAFQEFQQASNGFPMELGFEVAHQKLIEFGPACVPYLKFQYSNLFLLELDTRAPESMFHNEYARSIYELQGMGLTVIIAHPERYVAVQKNPQLALELAHMGCLLQASADFAVGGRLGNEKKPAKRLIKLDAYDFLGSDAHCPGHYAYFSKALKMMQ